MMKQQSERLGKDPIPQLLVNLAVPATFGMFVMALYNVVDTIFVATAVGTVGVAAVSIAFPVQLIIMALAGCIGIGGASAISRILGANKLDEANSIFGNVVSLIFLVSIAGIVLGLNFLEPILYMFGSSETILPYAKDYLEIILYGTFFFAFAFAMNNIIRSEGNAKTAMITMVLSAALNIILTPLFIFGFGMGIKGSALATVLAQAITAIYLLFYFIQGKSSLTFKAIYLRPNLTVINQILAVGSSAFAQQAASSIMFVFANHMLIYHGGDLGVAVFGIVHKIIMFSMMPVIGIVQGLLPLVGFNYGANQYQRVSESITLAIKTATIVVVFAFIVVMVFPKQLMLIFTKDADAIQMGITALRIVFAVSFTIGVQIVTGGVFQALGEGRIALVLSMSRQILFLIPLLLILPMIFQLTGVWLAFPLADLLSFFLALWFINRHRSLFIAKKNTYLS